MKFVSLHNQMESTREKVFAFKLEFPDSSLIIPIGLQSQIPTFKTKKLQFSSYQTGEPEQERSCRPHFLPAFLHLYGELQFCSYGAWLPEQETMERTGHRFIDSVSKYKCQGEKMLHDIFKALEPK